MRSRQWDHQHLKIFTLGVFTGKCLFKYILFIILYVCILYTIYIIYTYFFRQNLNSDFTDSALGSSEKSPLPYGNFQLRESTVQSILSHPRYGPKYDVHKSPLSSNMYTYLKFGLPRVFPPNSRRDGSSGYDSSEDGAAIRSQRPYTRTRSDPDFCNHAHYHGGVGIVYFLYNKTIINYC